MHLSEAAWELAAFVLAPLVHSTSRPVSDGIPSLVEIVRSDNGGEFFGGEFSSVCNELLIEQALTPAYSPQYNGVAERGLGLIEEAAMAARIQAKVIFGHVRVT